MFTSDWLTKKLGPWKAHLLPLKDQPLQALEIGSYEGRSALWLLNHVLLHDESGIVCVDPWFDPEVEARFDANTATYRGDHRSKLSKIKSRSWDFFAACWAADDNYDLIYIDGDHSAKGVMEDAVWAMRQLKPGGILIFDDVDWKNPHGWKCDVLPLAAVRAFEAIYAKQIQVLHSGYQLIVRKL